MEQRRGGGHRLTAGLRSPQPLRYSSVAAAAKIVQKWEQDTEVSRTSYLNSENSNGAPPGGQWPLNPLQIQP